MFNNRFIYAFSITSVLFCSSCKDEQKPIKQSEILFKKEAELHFYKALDSTSFKIDIELADNDYERQTGLMYRNNMHTNQGMLFVFDDVAERSFYMKNTKIGLDLIFIDENKTIVSFQKNAKPFDESSLPSNAAAKYVLEVNSGLINQWHLNIGDRINYTKHASNK